jgi:hypothetical protein
MRWWWDTKGDPSTLALLGLTVTTAVLTFAGEAIGIGIAYDVSPLLMLRADLDLDLETISPGWLVLGAGLGVVVLARFSHTSAHDSAFFGNEVIPFSRACASLAPGGAR